MGLILKEYVPKIQKAGKIIAQNPRETAKRAIILNTFGVWVRLMKRESSVGRGPREHLKPRACLEGSPHSACVNNEADWTRNCERMVFVGYSIFFLEAKLVTLSTSN